MDLGFYFLSSLFLFSLLLFFILDLDKKYNMSSCMMITQVTKHNVYVTTITYVIVTNHNNYVT